MTSFKDLKEKIDAGEAVDFVLINEEKKNGKKADTYENSGTVSLLYLKKKKLRAKNPKKQRAVEEGQIDYVKNKFFISSLGAGTFFITQNWTYNLPLCYIWIHANFFHASSPNI